MAKTLSNEERVDLALENIKAWCEMTENRVVRISRCSTDNPSGVHLDDSWYRNGANAVVVTARTPRTPGNSFYYFISRFPCDCAYNSLEQYTGDGYCIAVWA